jgi:hypothetical protein
MFYSFHPWVAGQKELQGAAGGMRAKISLVLIYLARLYC